jgi:hypothetical protein
LQSLERYTKPKQQPTKPSTQHNQGGRCRGGRGDRRGRGRCRGRGHQEKRKWYYIFHKENDNHSSNYCPDKKRFEATLEEEKKEKERNNFVNHSAPAWQNPNFGRNPFVSPFQPSHFSLEMKADRIGLDNTFTKSTSIFFVGCEAEWMLHRCGYGCGFFQMSDMVWSRIGVGVDAD